MSFDDYGWTHAVDAETTQGFLGVVELSTADGLSYVGDLFRAPAGHLELVPVGEAPLVLAWLPVIGIRLLLPTEQRLVLERKDGTRRKRRTPLKTPPPAPQPPDDGQGVLVLVS